jgi:predicted ABC-type ATPase
VRVKLGGHNISDDIIRRRFDAGLRNLFTLYMPIVTSWKILDNSVPGRPLDVAERNKYNQVVVANTARYERLKTEYSNDSKERS